MNRHPLDVLAFASQHYPQSIEITSLRSVTIDSARQNGKRPPYLKLAVTDEIAKQIRGREDSDLLVLVRVPREIMERQDSPIVLPGEAG